MLVLPLVSPNLDVSARAARGSRSIGISSGRKSGRVLLMRISSIRPVVTVTDSSAYTGHPIFKTVLVLTNVL